MRQIIVIAAIAALPASLWAGMQVTQKGRGGPRQEEAPIRVRNGSLQIETLRDSKWDPEQERWTQNRESPDAGTQLFAQVRFVNGGTCTVRGTVLTIEYGSSASATIMRAGKKIKVKPKGDFKPPDPTNRPHVLESSGGAHVTKVKAGDNSCSLESKEQLGGFFCVAVGQSGLDHCWDSERRR